MDYSTPPDLLNVASREWALDTTPLWRHDILGGGVVELIDTMPARWPMDWSVITAARTSVRGALKDRRADSRLLRRMVNEDHSSPFEQAIFQFHIDVPVIVYWHILRHRTARPNLESGRFRELRSKFYVPQVWFSQGTGPNKQQAGEPLPEALQHSLSQNLVEQIERGWELYQDALRLGVVRDQARYFLNFANVFYEGVWQIDANNLMKFLAKRNADDVQTETQEFAAAVETCFQTFMPLTHAFFSRKREALRKAVQELKAT